MTFNLDWPEVKECLKLGQSALDILVVVPWKINLPHQSDSISSLRIS